MNVFPKLIALAAAALAAGCSQTPRDHSPATASSGPAEVWGISCLSVASAREAPSHKAEMATQILMGGVVRVLNQSTNRLWYYVRCADGYTAYLEKGTFIRCEKSAAEAWQSSRLLIVTALEDTIRSAPSNEAEPVSDVVVAALVKHLGEEGDWYRVALPDQRTGYLPRRSAQDFATWKAARAATAENLERTGRQFLGRPYLWGGNSPKGFDCSGFTKIVFYLNGIDLNRNASQQARQGTPVPIDHDFSQLRKGDLLFFGPPGGSGRSQRIAHVGIYLGDKIFLHSSERVQINSLDPASPMRDQLRIRTLLFARRLLPAS